ncbi:type I restriction endonuclease subunit R [Hymenobacter sediminis]|uniref:type I restriction endonuclease subunit R n=1 Tax=Hymenobacter sediminis TaxID=2218621 RepID=UPI000DA6B189|nr:HsdR family type I site-specific deoxyribonuclease [Hymenobacter sediminis]RPD43765.1 type I restriction endonuclease subunit R [Hymenobacter sediminis]
MPTFPTTEDAISQVPALLLLQQLGYRYLSPEEALEQRGHREAEVLLKPILLEKLRELNSFQYRGQEYPFAPEALHAAANALSRPSLDRGYIAANKEVFDLLTLGHTVEQTVDNDKKSYTIRYIDWQNPANNAYHVTEELSVQRNGRADHYRPDIVLYVNGIPLVIIECKSPAIKEPLKKAIEQHTRNQQPDGIRTLYLFSQILIAACGDGPTRYATIGTIEELWAAWRERPEDDPANAPRRAAELQQLKNDSLNQPVAWQQLLRNPVRSAGLHPLQAGLGQPWTVTPQDVTLYALCQPERLLDLMRNFIVYDGGEKILARYQQYYGVRATLARARHQQGGVLWHSQGSGKSLTMVMLAQLLGATIPNAKIILVTDRTDLDDQLAATFDRCDRDVMQATTGNHLVRLLQDPTSSDIIATVINKFNSVVRKLAAPITRPDVFVLIDEGHRSQSGTLNINMQRVFPPETATFIAFTGTPLTKGEKATARKFGGIIHTYTISDAVADETVLPILYEGRLTNFDVNSRPLDRNFDRLTAHLAEEPRVRLKTSYSQETKLSQAELIIQAKAQDIADHYIKTWRGTGFKAQLVAPNKLAAVRYRKHLEAEGVHAEVLISPPDSREGNDDVHSATTDEVQIYWKRLMDVYGNPREYERALKEGWKSPHGRPEIMVVVDKLTTGYDNPRNVVLYLCRRISGHFLFQTIARVNRRAANKPYGFVLDYEGVTEELAEALATYTITPDLGDFDHDDLREAVRMSSLRDEVAQLPDHHAALLDLFKTILNKEDPAAYTALLDDEALRPIFFERLRRFQRTLHLALSSYEFMRNTPETRVAEYIGDIQRFENLRRKIIEIYAIGPNATGLEPQIQKLLDTYVAADGIRPITEQVNIFDRDRFAQVVAELAADGEAAQAFTITSRTSSTIQERFGEDPDLYRQFSDMVEAALSDYRSGRIAAAEFLSRATAAEYAVLQQQRQTAGPSALAGHDTAAAAYGLVKDQAPDVAADSLAAWAIGVEEAMVEVLVPSGKNQVVVDWVNQSRVKSELRQRLDDHLWDLRQLQPGLTAAAQDDLLEELFSLAQARFATR